MNFDNINIQNNFSHNYQGEKYVAEQGQTVSYHNNEIVKYHHNFSDTHTDSILSVEKTVDPILYTEGISTCYGIIEITPYGKYSLTKS